MSTAAILYYCGFFWSLITVTATTPALRDTMKPCGEISCHRYEYCARQQKHCFNCDSICEKTDHNYNGQDCQELCQDYIHDIVEGHVKKDDLRYIEDILNKIYHIVSVTCVLVLCLTSVAAVFGFRYLYQWRKRVKEQNVEKKKYQQKLTSVQYSIANNGADNNNRNEMIRTLSHSMKEAGPSTMTLTTQTTAADSPQNTNVSSLSGTAKTLPLSNVEPCEDRTLDYAAYVNQALSSSPTGK